LSIQLQVQFSEKINQQQSRFNVELSSLREQLQEAETHRDILQREVIFYTLTQTFILINKCIFNSQLQQVRDKLDSTRLESLTDSEETIAELRKRHDREKKILLDDNRKLISELEMLGENTRRFQAERMQMDNDYEELRSKRQAISQWERQISEIIQWVSDEKDARSYLQALATKMTEELDYLKHTGMKKWMIKIVISCYMLQIC